MQNIDGLETRVRLCADLNCRKPNRGRFARKSIETSWSRAILLSGGVVNSYCKVVQLHGDLWLMKYDFCHTIYKVNWSWEFLLFNEMILECQSCHLQDQQRQDRKKRSITIGLLWPNIILYGKEHPSADAIGKFITHDLALLADILLILETFFHVHGLKILVKEFAKAVHSDMEGKVIFVNLTKPLESIWKGIINY